ncbi:hypothetical protein [Actinomadura rugatobispora]|uniref:XRE family transcriptional regulator n=1 Tax=Actinomadura rugatobispora TaxID=1994 RepID=A0ABW1AEZ3_9ACTN|nr:hypothetical protein GCM10010200_025100 [Actinomadura rugatobispora]
MSVDRGDEAVEGFAEVLRRGWSAAGPPTYGRVRTMSERSDLVGSVCSLPKSTVHGVISGKKRQQLPQWRWVYSFLVVLREIAKEDGLDPDTVGTVEEWNARYKEAALEITERSRPSPVGVAVEIWSSPKFQEKDAPAKV